MRSGDQQYHEYSSDYFTVTHEGAQTRIVDAQTGAEYLLTQTAAEAAERAIMRTAADTETLEIKYAVGRDRRNRQDVTFKEDANNTIDKLSAQNLNILRKFCLSILKMVEILKPNLSMRKKRFVIGQDAERYIETALSF